MGLFEKIFGTYSEREIKRINPIVDKVLSLESEYSALSEEELKAKTSEFKERYANGETLDDLLPEAFATAREAAWRVLNMKHYPVQIIGGIVLHQGRIAEMKTGEGKTLVATLPVYLNAISGKGVHVVTVNDYLAQRDSEWMGKLYNYLGLSVGLIVHGKSKKDKRKAYAADITYGTNNEYGFDYLRDNMVTYKSQQVQRGLNYAIIDEVDSILVDEARTPLIISGKGGESSEMYGRADAFVRTLKPYVVAETDTKESTDDIAGDADYVVDEKAKTAVLTSNGTAKAERYFNIDNLSDEANFDLQHFINNGLKAHGTMHRDEQYIVNDGEIVIVDDFTGRLMEGRRYSDGLHQAIEAKEGVKVERESKTLATITFQNFFRMYKKLAGMTGTALTEEDEFQGIYSLDVIEIPTNKPVIREDVPDAVYKTERGKLQAVAEAVKEANDKGQPVLVGTVSVEDSEKISKIFTKNGIKHNVLNAKQHSREAEIVAQAGQLGGVTVATNMAGRGTDILLGGNPEHLAKQEMRQLGYEEELIEASTAHNDTEDEQILKARDVYQELYAKHKLVTDKEKEKVIAVGGLFIVGTERHESRRIDNQLRGRSGRQGDIGESKFYLSLEDDLMRQFGGEQMTNMFNTLGVDEYTEIQHRMLSNAIESSQKKVEGRNFGIRKNVLEYDDVMNQQREVIYAERNKVLDGEDLQDVFESYINLAIENIVTEFSQAYDNIRNEEINLSGLIAQLRDITGDLDVYENLEDRIDSGDDFAEITVDIQDAAIEKYHAREEEVGGAEIMREAERVVLLKTVDSKWMDHIDDMDRLKSAISMRSVAQHNPAQEYRREGYMMFQEMNESIARDSARLILRAQFVANEKPERKEEPKNTTENTTADGEVVEQDRRRTQQAANAMRRAEAQKSDAKGQTAAPAPVTKNPNERIGRNDPCHCGSGKKFKNCHGK